MNIFFDVDNTIITWDVKLRPGVHEVFTRLREDGHTIYLWSGMGPRWEVVKRFDLHEHVADCFWKPLHNHHARMEEQKCPRPAHQQRVALRTGPCYALLWMGTSMTARDT